MDKHAGVLCDLSEVVVSSGVKQDLHSLPRNWTWVAWMRPRNPRHQSSKGQRLEAIFPGKLPPVKNVFNTEAETVNAGTEFIIRDVAQQQVGEHMEKWFVQLRQKQGERHTRGERLWVSHLVRWSTVRRQLSHLYRAVLLGLCLASGQLSGLFFHT